MFTQVHCIIAGKVQGVAYRDFTQRVAKDCELTGWVKNREDGTVEVLAQGLPDNLKSFIEQLHEGSVLASVDSVGVDWQTPAEHFDDFVVIFLGHE